MYTYVDYYPRLARALLDCGDDPTLVTAFLCAEYGLDLDQAKAAIVLGRHLADETDAQSRPAHRSRTRSGVR